jgi:cytochrome b involved in lipid metabolism
VLFKTYTPKTLVPFDGNDGGRILLAINGIVFDVTAGRNFYGPSECLSPSWCCSSLKRGRWNVWKLCWPRCIARNGEAVV